MKKFVQYDVGIFSVIDAAVAEVELPLSRHAAADIERVVGAGERMRIDRKRVRNDAPRAGVAERLHVALAAVDLEVGVYLFELRLAAVEEERLRCVGVRRVWRIGV